MRRRLHYAAAAFHCVLAGSGVVPSARAADGGRDVPSFTLNPGLKARCDWVPDKCEVPYEYLKKFRSEPRDASWAGQIEPALKSALLEKDPNMVFRHLECRKTVCLVEYATTEMIVHFSPPAPLGDKIHVAQNVFAQEYLSDGTVRLDVLGFYYRLPR